MKEQTKKIILFCSIGIILIIGIILLFYIINKEKYLSIEIASNDITYSYGPNNQSEAIISINDEIKLNIFSEKKDKVKCYSSNENVLKINVINIATAISNGNAEIHCELGNVKSNIINVKVGE